MEDYKMEKYTIDLEKEMGYEGIVVMSSMQDVFDFANKYNVEIEDVFDMMGIEQEEDTEIVTDYYDEGYGQYECHYSQQSEVTIKFYSAFGKEMYWNDFMSKWEVA